MVGPGLGLKLREEPRDAVGVPRLPRPRLDAVGCALTLMNGRLLQLDRFGRFGRVRAGLRTHTVAQIRPKHQCLEAPTALIRPSGAILKGILSNDGAAIRSGSPTGPANCCCQFEVRRRSCLQLRNDEHRWKSRPTPNKLLCDLALRLSGGDTMLLDAHRKHRPRAGRENCSTPLDVDGHLCCR